MPDGHTLRNAGRAVFALSPDGRRFVYNTTTGLHLREMDELEARVIPGTEGLLTNPFFSPDGQWIAYFSSGKITKIAISGGAAIPLTTASNPFGGNWESDGTILFGQQDGIHRVSDSGGESEVLVKARTGETLHGPQLLPGGDWVLFTSTSGQGVSRWDQAEIVAQSLKGDERVVLWRGGSDARYVPTGHLIYALKDGLFAVPFDLESLKPTGGAVSIAQGVVRGSTPTTNTATANYGFSRDGSLAYLSGISDSAAQRSLFWVDRRTLREEAIAAEPRGYAYPRLSPDERRVAIDDRSDNDIQLWDFAAKTLTRLTFGSEPEVYPAWTPTNDRIAYSVGPTITWKAANNTGSSTALIEKLPTKVSELDPYFFSPDGSQLVFRAAGHPETRDDVGMISVKGGSEPTWLLQTKFSERNAELSPDGRWMAYESDETGDWEIYVQPFPNVSTGRWQISDGGGHFPLWSRNTNELFYVQPGVKPAMMAAQFSAGREYAPGPRLKLFDASNYFVTGLIGRPFDVARNGRFLMLKPLAEADGNVPPPKIVVVENWFEELKQRATAR